MINFNEFKKTSLLKLKAANKDEKDFFVAISYLLNISVGESYLVENIDKANMRKLKKIVKLRIKKDIPLNLILNIQNFYGREFFVNRNVLKPRFDTECLVEQALKEIKQGDKILDLCCGSGNIGITISKEKDTLVSLSDISRKAIKVAKVNAKKFDAKVEFIKSDLFKKFKKGVVFDCIISNPPYLDANEFIELDKEVKNYDPYIALVAGSSGLEIFKRIASEVKPYLKKSGLLFLEVGYLQAREVLEIFTKVGFKGEVIKDYNNIERIVKCRIL